jgi:hypothetical protein
MGPGLEPREVRVAATRSAPEALGMVRDGEGRPEELRVLALVGMHVGIPPVDVLQGFIG